MLPLWLRWLRICLQCQRPRFDPWAWNIPWEREEQTTAVFLPGEFHGQRSLVDYSPLCHKESDRTEHLTLSHFQTAQEKHSCIPTNSVRGFPFLHKLPSTPAGSDGKESACNAEDMSSIPGLGRSPVEENGNPLQYSCLENPMDRGTWGVPDHGVVKSWIQLTD